MKYVTIVLHCMQNYVINCHSLFVASLIVIYAINYAIIFRDAKKTDVLNHQCFPEHPGYQLTAS